MPIILTSKNIEDIIFKNKKITSKLTRHKHIFDNWNMSQVIPALKFIRSESISKLLKNIDSDDINILKYILQDDVIILRDDSSLVHNVDETIENLEFQMPEDFNCIDFCLYRKNNFIGVTLWK